MPNIITVLKAEITRLAKKEAKAATAPLKRASVQYRRDIARLKRLLAEQRQKTAHLETQEGKRLGEPPAAEEPLAGIRFSARSVNAQRKRLGLSALEYGKLVGVAPLTIYHWEQGKARPRKAQMSALVAVRGIGKREAVRRLEMLRKKAAPKKAVKRPRRAKK